MCIKFAAAANRWSIITYTLAHNFHTHQSSHSIRQCMRCIRNGNHLFSIKPFPFINFECGFMVSFLWIWKFHPKYKVNVVEKTDWKQNLFSITGVENRIGIEFFQVFSRTSNLGLSRWNDNREEHLKSQHSAYFTSSSSSNNSIGRKRR